MNAMAALQQYRGIGNQGAAIDATPHQLILMLIDGAVEKTLKAKGKMMHGEMAEKGSLISGSIAIVDTLRVSLDHEAGGELADNLARLYDYMIRRLLEANMKNQPELLDEVISLLKEVREAWTAIPQEYHSIQRRTQSAGMMSASAQ
jgi:flagellar secretion chaperone FliS